MNNVSSLSAIIDERKAKLRAQAEASDLKVSLSDERSARKAAEKEAERFREALATATASMREVDGELRATLRMMATLEKTVERLTDAKAENDKHMVAMLAEMKKIAEASGKVPAVSKELGWDLQIAGLDLNNNPSGYKIRPLKAGE